MRTHEIDLSPYTEGDPDFRRELAGLMIKNIQDLKDSLSRSITEKNPEFYTAACHKVKTTIDMVNDHNFSAVVETLKQMLIEKMYGSHAFDEKVGYYRELNEKIIQSLQKEM
jgi:hypothetical protein